MDNASYHSYQWYLRPNNLFVVFSIVNLINFVDRGIIPGATNEFNSFITDHVDTSTPDVYLGLLQSAFIVGLIAGSIIFGNMIHYKPRFFITAVGCSIWVMAVLLSGIAGYASSYTFLVFARMLSGVGEASLQVAIPPFIQKTAAEAERGIYLAIFFTAVPVGTALGYAYSSIVAENIGWEWAFFIEGIIMVPFVVFMFFITPYFPCEGDHEQLDNSISSVNAKAPISPIAASQQATKVDRPSFIHEFAVVMSKPLFLCVALGYAAQTAMLIGLSTFGSSFLMSLGYFNTESASSTVFGVLISISGVLSTPGGGIVLDKMIQSIGTRYDRNSFSASITAINTKPSPLQDKLLTASTASGPEGCSHTNGNSDCNDRSQQRYALLSMHEGDSAESNDNDSNPIDRLQQDGRLRSSSAPLQEESVLRTARLMCEIDEDTLQQLKLDKAFKLMTVSNAVGMVIMCMLYFLNNRYAFLFLVCIGCGLIFMSTPASNMAVMMTVPDKHRSFAIALNIMILHGLGDVPSPIIVGLMKDTLAPDCVPNADDDGEGAATSDACRDDAEGIRVTMFLVSAWLAWTVLFFALGWYLNKFHHKKCAEFEFSRELCCCCCNGESSMRRQQDALQSPVTAIDAEDKDTAQLIAGATTSFGSSSGRSNCTTSLTTVHTAKRQRGNSTNNLLNTSNPVTARSVSSLSTRIRRNGSRTNSKDSKAADGTDGCVADVRGSPTTVGQTIESQQKQLENVENLRRLSIESRGSRERSTSSGGGGTNITAADVAGDAVKASRKSRKSSRNSRNSRNNRNSGDSDSLNCLIDFKGNASGHAHVVVDDGDEDDVAIV